MAEVDIIKAVRWEECERWSSTNRETLLFPHRVHKAPLIRGSNPQKKVKKNKKTSFI